MKLYSTGSLFVYLVVCCVLSCSPAKRSTSSPTKTSISSFKLLGEYDIPYAFSYNSTTVGGLSGIDYDATNETYYLISDDRSAINPARFYAARIFITSQGIDSVRFTAVKSIKQPGGNVYPNSKQSPANTPDPEAIRYNPLNNYLVWTSEGERIVRGKDTVLEDPSIRFISTDGTYIDSLAIPENLVMQATEKGPRQNGVFEGACFTDHYKTLFVSVEEPLYEDGPRADITDNNAYIRLLKFNLDSKRNSSQYAYKLDPVAYASNPVNAYKINGVPDILSLGNDKFLFIERSYSTGRLACTVKVFQADLMGATDIKDIPSLKATNSFKPIAKKLLLNMDDLGIYIDNIEGMTFGPLLPNGHRTMLFVADNNFSPIEKSQLLLFEVIE
ncbi:esterase-like activity of phytase family protein [soil metagenome]